MASGDALAQWTALANEASEFAASFDIRSGQGIPVLAFDAASDEFAIFSCVLPTPHTANADVVVSIYWIGATATTGDVVWTVDVQTFSVGETTDVAAWNPIPAATVTQTVSAVSGGAVNVASVTIATYAGAPGEVFRVRIARDANHASDTMAGDAHVLAVYLNEA